jgi:predicted DNA-binding transcriptional regulator YafY
MVRECAPGIESRGVAIMGRNTELIRQWTLLQRIAGARGNTIPKLATDLKVSTRTIRRDLEALQLAGFPVYDEIIGGTKFWRMETKPLGALARHGLTFAELSALYFSRALIEGFAGSHLLRDLQSALDKFEAAFSPAMKKFLDRFPKVISAKREFAKRQDTNTYVLTARLLDAIFRRHVVSMRYHSVQSRREKVYLVHPYRLIHAQGGLYLIAFVPAYSEVRTFALERIRRASAQEEGFEPVAELDTDPFSNSLGVHRGTACRVKLSFHAQVAESIKERTWHRSQQFKDRSDGSVTMTLEVSDDYALRSWILGFGRFVRVVAPPHLAEWVREELEQAGQQYVSGATAADDAGMQPSLPFTFRRLASA